MMKEIRSWLELVHKTMMQKLGQLWRTKADPSRLWQEAMDEMTIKEAKSEAPGAPKKEVQPPPSHVLTASTAPFTAVAATPILQKFVVILCEPVPD
ncbi:hypothetical protein GPALN_012159 [Globodera pallida]|nr:hypothetical protein GPALN_012159 [Globodera pallida]